LQRQVDKVRSDESYEYNKTAIEKGNLATYYVEEAANHKIQDLQGKINDARQEQADWENRARQAGQDQLGR